MADARPADREIVLRFDGICTICRAGIPKTTRAIYTESTKSVRHVACAAIDRGTAAGSAQREYERRATRDAAAVEHHKSEIRVTYGDGFLGKVATFLAVDARPRQSTEVWSQGAVGEMRVAAELDRFADVGVVALHDRRIPGTRANIDHLVITPWAVWIIDAKRYVDKRPELVVEGGIFGIGGRERLKVGGRYQDKLVEGVLWQSSEVARVIDKRAPVHGALCFVDSNWPLLGGAFSVRKVEVTWPRRLAKTLLRTAPPRLDVDELARVLAVRFPPA